MDGDYPHTLRHQDTATVEFKDIAAVYIKGCDALYNHDKIHGVTSRNKYLVATLTTNKLHMRTATQMSLAEDPEVKRIGLFRVVAILQNDNIKKK
jgi:hypothetical protein